jgi:mitochondrial translocator assembly and maintenance protein 41
LHKPVVTILADQDDVLEAQQQTRNLPAALAAALLLQWNDERPHHCSSTIHCLDAHEVYTRIASLSYTGDPRMLIRAEDPNKISNLVRSAGQMERFHNLYQTATANLVQEGILSMNDTTTNNQWTWDSTNPLAHARLWQSLPVHVRSQCRYEPNTTNNDGSAATVVSSAAASQRLPAVLASIVAPAARYQSAKGLWTAGLTKSVVYAYRKLYKGLLLKR